MEYREDIGFQVRTLSHLVKRAVDKTAFSGEDPLNKKQKEGNS